jgi:hypothetical protein
VPLPPSFSSCAFCSSSPWFTRRECYRFTQVAGSHTATGVVSSRACQIWTRALLVPASACGYWA